MSDKVFNRAMALQCLLGLVVVGLDLWYWRP